MSELLQLRDWQVASEAVLRDSLLLHGIAADASDTGTGKTYKVCYGARVDGVTLVVVCPKSVIPDWESVAGKFGVRCHAFGYEKIRTGKTPFGHWEPNGQVFVWTLPPNHRLVFDEAHRCGGLKFDRSRPLGIQPTMNARLLVAARRQRVPTLLLSATLIGSPLKGYAIGYALGLHNLTNFWQWARSHGVIDGYFGPEWQPHRVKPPLTPRSTEEVMQRIREAIGDKFTRIRKADVPGFPEVQHVPTFVQTAEMPDLESDYGTEARTEVEMLKIPGIIAKAKDLIEDDGLSVAIFVNFSATMDALIEAFPHASVVRGGQSKAQRREHIDKFQNNETDVILLMSSAGGTGTNLHDLHGKPRAALICPSHDAVEFLQVLGRIHRDGSLSRAINYILFASGVPVERRIRAKLEAKLNNLTALNDHDLASGSHSQPAAPITAPAGQARHPTPMTTLAPTPDQPQQVSTAATPPAPAGGHAARKHAPCSPSKLKNFELCPSYEPDDSSPPHPITLRGTAMHEALETGDDSQLDPQGVDGVQPNADIEKGLVAMCREFLAADRAENVIEVEEDEALCKTHEPDVYGIVDKRMFTVRDAKGRRKALIRDYKMGFNLVDCPSVNGQAAAYVLGTFLEFEDVDEIHFAFLIPRLDAVLQHTFTRADITALMLRISTIAQRRRKLRGREFNLVEDNCLYCGNKFDCPEMKSKFLPLANAVAEADRLPVPSTFAVEAMTRPEDVSAGLNLARMAKEWAEQMNGFGLRFRLELGQEIPGYDLIQRSAKREIANPVAAYDVARTEFGVTSTEFIAASKISITSLEESVRSHAPDGQKEEVAARFSDRLLDTNAMTRGAPFHVLQKSRKRKVKPAS